MCNDPPDLVAGMAQTAPADPHGPAMLCARHRQRPDPAVSGWISRNGDMGNRTPPLSAAQDVYVERLAECVALDGVSADPTRRHRIVETVAWAQKWIERLGGSTRLVELGDQTLADGSKCPLPPVLLAEIGNDPAKKTLGIYGHLDVQPAAKEDGWNTDPWVLTNVDGKLYGRGTTDDKGPVLAWLWYVVARGSPAPPVATLHSPRVWRDTAGPSRRCRSWAVSCPST